MEASESIDLESLVDLIDENESRSDISETKESNNHEKTNALHDADLDSLIGLFNEDDFAGDISASGSTEKQKRIIKLNDCTFSDAENKLDGSSSSKHKEASLIHRGDTSSDEEEKEYLTEAGQQIKQKIKLKSHYREKKIIKKFKESESWKSGATEKQSNVELHSLDKLIGVRIINPLIAFDVMQQRLNNRKLIKMSFIKNYVRKGNEIEGEWVTIGVLVRKHPPRTSKVGKIFSIWRLTDLHNTEKTVTFFLFGIVHTEHWKTAVGTVIGILNPTIMDPDEKQDYLAIKVDHPGKIMLIGTSKDFGHCKSKTKDGSQCNNAVNLSQCQYCAYHVKSEYRKFSPRSDIQSSWSGSGLNLKDKVLKRQNIFYGGQSFVPLGKQQKKSNSIKAKDKLTLSNLTLMRKAATVFNEEKSKSVNKIAEMYGETVSKTAEKNSEFINNQLLIPSAGSRNFLQHMIKNKAPEEKNISVGSVKEFLKQRALQMRSQMNKKDDSTILKNLEPVLGKGLNPGQSLTFDIQSSKSNNHGQYAKFKAIQKIREIGPIKRKNPNAVKSNPEPKKIKEAIESSFEENSVNDKTEEKGILRSRLGCIDLNSEKIQRILNQKSSHAYEVEMAEMEREAAYFDRLEKKEMMEEKMSSTKEIVCDVVSCKQCRYTAHKAADRCKDERHPLKCHKAIKRFFECKDCKKRTECFNRFPHQSCSMCGGSRYERTGMIKIRSGPKLDSEMLNIKGDDAYYLNSL